MVVDQIVLDHNKMQRFPSTDTKGLDQNFRLKYIFSPYKIANFNF
jgi:hypothetical protein